MILTHEQRIFRLRIRIQKNRLKFDELAKSGQTAKWRACVRVDRYLRKQLATLEEERHVGRCAD